MNGSDYAPIRQWRKAIRCPEHRETLGIPSGLGHDTVIPWDATSTVRLLNRTRLGMGAVTILLELCPVGSIVWLAYGNRGWTER